LTDRLLSLSKSPLPTAECRHVADR